MRLERALHDVQLHVRMSREERGQPEGLEILSGQGAGLVGLCELLEGVLPRVSGHRLARRDERVRGCRSGRR
jgi:hypothetical protein